MLQGSGFPGIARADVRLQHPADGAGSCRDAHAMESKPLGLETPLLSW